VPHEVGTLAFDGWTVTFGTARRGLGGACNSPNRPTYGVFLNLFTYLLTHLLTYLLTYMPLLAVPNVTAHYPPINGQCTNHRISV